MNEDNYCYNPYDFINPIKKPKFFAGRHEELKEIDYYLEISRSKEPKYFHLALIGPRSVGKTSFLNMIEYTTEEKGFLTVKIALNKEISQNDVLFFKEVFDGLMTRGAERGMYGGLKGRIYKAFRRVIDLLDVKVEIPLLFGTAYIGLKRDQNVAGLPQHVLIHDLKEIYEKAKEKNIATIVLLFDECDLLAQNEAILQKIRNAFMEIEGYILAFSGTERMFPAISDVFSPIPRFFKRINVENFKDIRDTEECLLKPLNEDEKKAFDQACIGEIHRITNGSPYEINLIAHYMYRKWKEGINPKIGLSAEVLDDILNEIERLRKKEPHEIANKIKQYWADQLKILISLLEFPNVSKEWLTEYMLIDEIDTLQIKDSYVKKSIKNDYIELLKKDNVIIEENGRIRFKGDQFDVLYLKYLCTSKGVKEPKDFLIGTLDDPLMNVHNKLIQGVALKDFQEYHIQTGFDKREKIDGRTGQKFIFGARAKLPPGEHTVLLLSQETQKEFYLGVPNSIRFRVNIEWMKEGFVTQVKFKRDEDKENFQGRLNALKEKLEFLGYKILLKDEISWNVEGTNFLDQQKLPEAIDCFDKAIEINPLFELPWANKASIFLTFRKYEDALECINKALELRPNWSEVLTLKGAILINLNRNEEALECLEKSAEINPEYWKLWDSKGRAYFNLKKYKEAKECFNRSLKLKKDNYEALNLKGLCLLRLNKNAEAIKSFDEVLKFNPNFVPALFYKGKALLNKKDYTAALECIEDVLGRDSFNIEALILKGIAFSELGRNEEAIDLCKKIIEEDQNLGVAWYNKACFEAKAGNVNSALESLKRAIEIDESFIEIAKNEDDFADIRTDARFMSLIQGNS